jgi:hypothetical protein
MGVGDLRPLSSTLPEQDARYELLKWQPVRRSTKDFTKRGGLNFDGQYLQLYARVFTRDLYQFNLQHHSQLGPHGVAFVLTLSSGTHDGSIYNSMVQELGSFVESAVVDIEVPNE